MTIKSSSSLRNDYDNMVQLAKKEPVYITRNGEGEMVFISQELFEAREAELTLFEKLLTTEREMLAGAKTYTVDEVECELEDLYGEM